MEVVVCHTTIVLQLVVSECIDLTETHLISAFSTTDDLSAIACVARSTRDNDDTWRVLFDKVKSNGLCISVKPHVLREDSQLNRLC